MIFSIVGHFKPGGAVKASEAAAEFSDHLAQPLLHIPLAGALRNAEGEETGFMLLLEAKSFADAQDFLSESPSARFYDRVEISSLDVEVGRLP
jgi:hypothetical protein